MLYQLILVHTVICAHQREPSLPALLGTIGAPSSCVALRLVMLNAAKVHATATCFGSEAIEASRTHTPSVAKWSHNEISYVRFGLAFFD